MVKHYDLKVGYTCNNHCKHCMGLPHSVVDPYKNKLISRNEPIDTKFSELIKIINSKEFSEASSITITGGEPSLRPEFFRILKYIVEKYNNTKYICIQTNGRLMYKYFDKIRKLSDKIHYVVAIHGTEEVHNLVTSNLNGNPFKETWDSLIEFKRAYEGTNYSNFLRIEVVLSNYNLDNIPTITKKLLDFGLFNIGFSYPHVDGYYQANKDSAREIAFPYSKMKKLIVELYKLSLPYAENNKIRMVFEEAPLCMFVLNKEEAEYVGKPDIRLIRDILFREMYDPYSEVCVKFPSSEVETNFIEIKDKTHRKPEICEKCIYSKCCQGVWYEAVEMFGNDGFIPLTEEGFYVNLD